MQEAASGSSVAAQMGVAGGVAEGERYGAEYLARSRLGQGAFRVMVTDAYQGRRLREQWHNGREYYVHHGEPLRFHPADRSSRPASEFLEWHNENRFHE